MGTRKRKFFREGTKIQLINSDKTFFYGDITMLRCNCIGIKVNINQYNCRILNEKESVQFIYATEDTAIMYRAKVIGYKLGDKLQVVLLSTPEMINKIERRKEYRVTALMNVKYSFLPPDSTFVSKDDVSALYLRRMRKTFSVDISTGGINLITYHNNDGAKQATVTMIINGKEITALCNVVRVESKAGKNIKTAFEFIDITNDDRESIRNYVESKLKQTQVSI